MAFTETFLTSGDGNDERSMTGRGQFFFIFLIIYSFSIKKKEKYFWSLIMSGKKNERRKLNNYGGHQSDAVGVEYGECCARVLCVTQPNS